MVTEKLNETKNALNMTIPGQLNFSYIYMSFACFKGRGAYVSVESSEGFSVP